LTIRPGGQTIITRLTRCHSNSSSVERTADAPTLPKAITVGTDAAATTLVMCQTSRSKSLAVESMPLEAHLPAAR
jgi:hypothetical protein